MYGNAAQGPITKKQNYQQTVQGQEKTSPTGCGKHTILCLGADITLHMAFSTIAVENLQ